MVETIPDSIVEHLNRDLDFLDFPTAWSIQHNRGEKLNHDPKCSSVPGHHPLSGPGLLCDCGAVRKEWERLRELHNA